MIALTPSYLSGFAALPIIILSPLELISLAYLACAFQTYVWQVFLALVFNFV
jgi:hypothetical protein